MGAAPDSAVLPPPKETIAGHEGFVVKIYNTSNDQEVLMSELALHPDLPVALRARHYKKTKLKVETLLLEFAFSE